MSERTAFLAGFDVSTEGFNGEWGPPDEWIECYFEEWKKGTPVPSPCGATCGRPAGHQGEHEHTSRERA